MIVFKRKLRKHKTSANRPLSAAATALFIRNLETRKFVSLSARQKGVCLEDHKQILCFPKLEMTSGYKLTTQQQERQALKVKKPAIYCIYDFFGVELT
ncbi:MAG: hypothetical protein EAZ77_04580 [Nostocales cyanobacterium]|nr:MAG: hypothetical protein EAZ77_04580 [Nostocales cyanobacterium]